MNLSNEQTRIETPTFGGGEHQETFTLNSNLLFPSEKQPEARTSGLSLNFQTVTGHDFRKVPGSRPGLDSGHGYQFVPRNACSASWLCGELSCKLVSDRVTEAEADLHEVERFMLTTYTRGGNLSIDSSAGRWTVMV